ncbi:MAG: oligopeptide transporter, OPT family [Ignavibacteria bacterium]|nr:oligopeptide transporter, OPT family [Ignavibacteria bacterium]
MESENISTTTVGLPENAHRELKHGEVYRPILQPEYKFPETTAYSISLGLLMAIIFSAAAAYSGLKIGQVMEAAIPISIIAVGISAAARKRKALGQNVIVQSIGASSGVIVAGAIFTIPALYILKLNASFFQIFFASMLGGFLGILFLIPFRKFFVKEMHGKFPFPEATAITEILVTGEKGGKSAGVLVTSGIIGGLYDFCFSSLHLWKETFTSRVLPWGEVIADKLKLLFQLNVSAMIFGFGYLIGLKYSLIITIGSFLSWFVIIPLINQIGQIAAAGSGANFFAAMPPEQIFSQFVRPIGIGAIAMAGIIGILKSYKIIGNAFSLAIKGFTKKKKQSQYDAELHLRTQKDISMHILLLLVGLTIVGIFIFLLIGVNITPLQAIIALLTVVIISFLFTSVAANAIAIVGTNPVSGMTLMTLILSSLILTQAGLSGKEGMISALVIGGIVCTALSMAGGFITDLKVGYWIGSTPLKQESYKFLGAIVSAATVGLVIFILNASYGFTKEDYVRNQNIFTQTELLMIENGTADKELLDRYAKALNAAEPLVAPQANAMAAVIQPLMSPQAKVDWILYLVGVFIALFVNWLGISPLAFALGMYLPLPLNTPLLVGGLISHFVQKWTKEEKLRSARVQRGTLIASGFMAGASLFGVVGALLLFFKVQLYKFVGDWGESNAAEWLSIIMFALLILYFVLDTLSAKPDKE